MVARKSVLKVPSKISNRRNLGSGKKNRQVQADFLKHHDVLQFLVLEHNSSYASFKFRFFCFILVFFVCLFTFIWKNQGCVNPLERTFLFCWLCPIFFLSSCSNLSSFWCFPLNTFPSHPLSKPNQLPFGGSFWFFCCCCLDCCCVLYSFFFVGGGDLPYLCLCLLCCFDIMTTNAIFPAILGFLKGVSVSCNWRDVLLLFSPNNLYLTLSVCHFFLVVSLFLLSSL